jgi:5-methyltetrahydrofolate--homocysteine methyltransferase
MEDILRTRVLEKSVLVSDGAMGTMLFAKGLQPGSSPELWNVEEPTHVRDVHKSYVESGAEIILTNSFGGNVKRLELHGLDSRTEELNQAAAEIARQVSTTAPPSVLVAGSIGPTGLMLEPLGDLTYTEAVSAFQRQAKGLDAGGVDVFWIETMSALEEVHTAIEGCRLVASEKPIAVTMTFDSHGHTMMGVSPEAAIADLQDHGLSAIGANCGNGPEEIEQVIQKMHAVDQGLVLIAKSNAGAPRLVGDTAVFEATPEEMAEYALRIRQNGASIIGACCGSTPEHIQAIAVALR